MDTETLFLGVSVLHLHPMLVHFPIAYLVTALLAEGAFWITNKQEIRTFSNGLIALGALAATGALATGALAADALGHDTPGHDLIHEHRDIMLIITAALIATGIALFKWEAFRRGPERKALLPILLLLTAVMIFGAGKGGDLVYRFGVAVRVGTSIAVPEYENAGEIKDKTRHPEESSHDHDKKHNHGETQNEDKNSDGVIAQPAASLVIPESEPSYSETVEEKAPGPAHAPSHDHDDGEHKHDDGENKHDDKKRDHDDEEHEGDEKEGNTH